MHIENSFFFSNRNIIESEIHIYSKNTLYKMTFYFLKDLNF